MESTLFTILLLEINLSVRGERGRHVRQSVRQGRISTCNGSDVFKLQREHSGMRVEVCLALKAIAV